MATIQMANDIVHDIKESGEEIYGKIARASKPVIELTAVDSRGGEAQIWVNVPQVSTFM